MSASAQAPNISYGSSSYVFTVGAAITTQTPTNSGGAVPATTYATVTTYAGSTAGTAGTTNNTGTAARFNAPRWLTFDGSGNMFVADAGNNEIRKVVVATAAVTLVAGSTTGVTGLTNATGTAARFNGPYAITDDGLRNAFVADFTNNEIRKVVESTGVVTLVAGNTAGTSGMVNGTGTAASFNQPAGIVYDANSGFFYICDFGNNQIRRMTYAGAVTLFAGSAAGTSGSADGTGTAATFSGPNGITVDAAGNLYVADQNNNLIRKITPAGVVTTFAGNTAGGSADGIGTAASFTTPRGLDVDISGNIYVNDSGNNLVRMITPAGMVTTVAGTGSAGFTNGVGTAAAFDSDRGISVDQSTGNIYIPDYNNNVIRKMIGTGYSIYPTLPAGLSFNSTTGAISGTPTATSNATDYTITGFNASGCSAVIINIQCVQTNNWRGTTNTRWDVGSNWSAGTAPTANDAVQIGSAVTFTNQPKISNANALAYSITFGTVKTATITISAGRTLTVGGNITVNTGSTPTIVGSNASTSIVNMAPGSIVNILGTGKLTLTSPLNFTLQSDATGDASFGQLSATSLAGTALSSINVERYVSGGSLTYRGYRLMSSPVYSGTDTHANNSYSINYILNSSFLTGTDGVAGGFSKAGNPTLYLYRENVASPSSISFTSGNFRGIKNIAQTPAYSYLIDNDAGTFYIPSGNGFLFFFRGSTATTSPYITTTVPVAATLTTTGTLNIGNVAVKDWFTPTNAYLSVTNTSAVKGYNLVGNPYASAIDWDTFQTTSLASGGIYGTNVSGIIWMLDPVSHNFGSYISGNGGALGTNNATNIISSGQGFFVIGSTATTSTLTFTESAKTTTQNTGSNLLMGKPVNASTQQYLRLRMSKDAHNTDETIVAFNSNGSLNYDQNKDAAYKPGFGAVSLSGISKDKVNLSIAVIPLPKQEAEVIGLDVSATTDGIYSLTLKDIVAVPKLFDVWLMDKYRNDSLDMRQNKTYQFQIIKSDSTTYGPKRFALVIRQNPGFAYRLLDFAAEKLREARQVQLSWHAENEGNYTHFTIERSIDNGKTYDVVGGISGANQSTYSLVDKYPVNGTNLYRLKQEDINSTISYSKIVPIQYADLANNIGDNALNIYPNPVVNNLSISIAPKFAVSSSSYNIKFMNSSGILVKQFTSAQTTWQGSMNDLQPGTYIVQVIDGKNQNLVGQTKFVKL